MKPNKRKLITTGGIVVIIIIAILFVFRNQIFADVDTSTPYTVFKTDTFAQVKWDTLPSSSNVLRNGSTIPTFAAQGQTEDVSFSVRPNASWGSAPVPVQINVADLVMGDKIIPKSNIEVLNLKIWDQCEPKNGNGEYSTNCQNREKSQVDQVPELLVRHTDQDLVEAERNATADPSLPANPHRYNAPTVDDFFEANLSANQTHTFYLRIKVPEDAVAGDYTGRVTFTKKVGTQANFPPTNLKLGLKVYPFKLSESNKTISSFVGYRVSDDYFQNGMQSIGQEKFEEYLRFLKKSGFTSLVIQDYNSIVWIADKMNELGFKEIIWRAEPYPENYLWNAAKRTDIKNKIASINDITHRENASLKQFYVYGPDEVWGGGRAFASVVWNKFIHSAGGKIATTVIKQNYDMYNNNSLLFKDAAVVPDEFKDADYKIDLPIYATGYIKSAANLEPTQFFDAYPKSYYDMSWYFHLAMIKQTEGGAEKKYFDVPIFTALVRGLYMNATQSYNNRYTKSLSQGEWHHIAGVWDGPQNKYSLYVDSEPAYTISVESGKEFGSKILKNPMRTFIGGQPDRMNQVNPGQDNSAVSNFHGQISRIKVYNNALTKDQFSNSDSITPEADYDFSTGALADKTGKYPVCTNRGARIIADNPIPGKKSLDFDNGKYGAVDANGGVVGREGERANYLDCGLNPNNFNIDDKMTVEAWVKIPSRPGNFTNVYQGTIISQLENLPNRNYTTIEKYIQSLVASDRQSENEYYYNQIWTDNIPASTFRGLSGFYLQGSRLGGYVPYGLDSPFADQGKFYDDFDTQTKTWFAVLPNANGEPVKSLQFEAFRAGVDDSRYMATYENLLAELKKTKSEVAQSIEADGRIKNMINGYPYNSRSQLSFAGKLIQGAVGYVAPISDSKHQENRQLVADKIKNIVDALAVPTPVPTATSPSNQITYKFSPGLNIVGSGVNVSVLANNLTKGTGLSVRTYDSLTKQWVENPGNNLSLTPGKAYYVNNPTNQVKTVTVDTNAITAGAALPRLYRDGNFIYNNTQKTLNLPQIFVDIYDGTTCLAVNVSLDQLKDSEYIVKRPYIIDNLTQITTPTLAQASAAAGAVNSIPSKKGYWIFVKNNIANILKDTKYVDNRCN